MIEANRFSAAAMFLLACSVKATLLLGVAWFIARVTPRFSAAFRHTIWAAAILGTLVLPILVLLMPAWHSTVLANAAAVWGEGQSAAANGSAGKTPVTIVDAVLTAPATAKWAVLVLILWGLHRFCREDYLGPAWACASSGSFRAAQRRKLGTKSCGNLRAYENKAARMVTAIRASDGYAGDVGSISASDLTASECQELARYSQAKCIGARSCPHCTDGLALPNSCGDGSGDLLVSSACLDRGKTAADGRRASLR